MKNERDSMWLQDPAVLKVGGAQASEIKEIIYRTNLSIDLGTQALAANDSVSASASIPGLTADHNAFAQILSTGPLWLTANAAWCDADTVTVSIVNSSSATIVSGGGNILLNLFVMAFKGTGAPASDTGQLHI